MGLLWRPSSVFDDGSDHIPSGFSEEMLPVVGFWEVDAIAKSIEGTRGPSQQPALLRHATQPDSAMRWTDRVNAMAQAQKRFANAHRMFALNLKNAVLVRAPRAADRLEVAQ